MTKLSENAELQQSCITDVKSRFFAQYIGQKIIRWHQWVDETENCFVNLSIPEIEKKGWFINLKPLSKIINEDAEKLQFTLVNVIGLDGLIKENSIDLVKKVISNYTQIDCLFMLSSSFTDKARELGYAIDWNTYKVSKQIELGWVRLV